MPLHQMAISLPITAHILGLYRLELVKIGVKLPIVTGYITKITRFLCVQFIPDVDLLWANDYGAIYAAICC
jgi:hypothetical protein